jgi:DNA-binding GntR family transcriptional regulator
VALHGTPGTNGKGRLNVQGMPEDGAIESARRFPSLPRGYRTKQDIIIEALRDAILSGRLSPGKRLRQEALAKTFNASPTPIREAFRALQAEGLLTYIPHKGMTVAGISEGDIKEIYLLRKYLEGLAARLAVEHLGERDLAELEALQKKMEAALGARDFRRLARVNHTFHTIIHHASRARRLHEVISRLWLLSPFDMLWVVRGRAEQSVQEHWAILEALRSRDPDRAERALRLHVGSAADSLLRHIGERAQAGEGHGGPPLSSPPHQQPSGRRELAQRGAVDRTDQGGPRLPGTREPPVLRPGQARARARRRL